MSDTQLATVDRIEIPSVPAVVSENGITCNEDSSLDDLAAMNSAIEFAYERAKENRKARDDIFIAYINKHGPFTLGTVRYWLTKPKTVKCKDPGKAFLAVMDACGGDVDAIGRTLSANALKVGQCRTLLGAEFDTHFETIVRDKLESGEAAPLELASQDEAFIKPKRK